MPFIYERKINYYETDKMGIVHHSNYIKFLEEARMNWMEISGISMMELERLGYMIPTIEVDCKYKYHVTSEDVILIETNIIKYNGVRITLTYKILDKKTGNIVAEAYTRHCFTNKELKPINMKKHNKKIHDIFEKL